MHEITVPGGIAARFETDPGTTVEIDGRPAEASTLLGPGRHVAVVTGVAA
jgi:hypothetical protein